LGKTAISKEYEFFLARLKEALQEGKELARKGETREKYRAIEQDLQQYEQIFARLLTVPSEVREEVQRVSQELSEVGQRISTLADGIAEAKWAELEMYAHDADRIESIAKRHMGIILGFTGISSLSLGLYLTPKIVVPIRKLTDLINRAQEEDHGITIEVTSNDEIGELGRFINRMRGQQRIFDDFQAHKIAEERRRLEVLSNLLHDGVILIDSDGRVCTINPTALDFFGLSQSDVEGRSIKEIPVDEPFRQALLRSANTHERFHDSIIALMPSDSSAQLRKITLSIAFVRAENGEIMSLVCVFRELENDHIMRGAVHKVIKEVVEELAERLRATLQVKGDKDDKDDKREEREVG